MMESLWLLRIRSWLKRVAIMKWRSMVPLHTTLNLKFLKSSHQRRPTSRVMRVKEVLELWNQPYAFDISFVHDNQWTRYFRCLLRWQTMLFRCPKTARWRSSTLKMITMYSWLMHKLMRKIIKSLKLVFDANSFSDYGTVLADYYTNFVYKDSEENEQTIQPWLTRLWFY